MQYSNSLDMITKLVSFDTVSKRSNMSLISFVSAYLKDNGIQSFLVPNEDGNKANLYATVGPMVEGGVVLSGHTDVVPVIGQPWDTDPFTVIEKDGKLYGRGTCDMKGFIAVALALVPFMKKAKLNKPIHFALSYDEEIGCVGAPFMVKEMSKVLPKPMAVIVGEPTSMQVIKAHKGISTFKTQITGHEAHSSQPERGVSAVHTAARLILFLEEMMQENKQNADPDCLFEPPYSTIHVGLLRGGTAVNIISRFCEFSWEVRPIPGETSKQFTDRLQIFSEKLANECRKVSSTCGISTKICSDAPAMNIEEPSPAAGLCKHLSGNTSDGVVSYATEAGHFQAFEFSTVVCGPGSINQAHQPNEFIELSQIKEAEEFIKKLIEHLSH